MSYLSNLLSGKNTTEQTEQKRNNNSATSGKSKSYLSALLSGEDTRAYRRTTDDRVDEFNRGVDALNYTLGSWNKWYDASRSGLEGVGFGDAGDASAAIKDESASMLERLGQSRKWAQENKDLLGDNYDSVMKMLQEATTGTYWINKGYEGKVEDFGKWGSQAEYDQHQADVAQRAEAEYYNTPGALADAYDAWKKIGDARAAYDDLDEIKRYQMAGYGTVPEEEREALRAQHEQRLAEITETYGVTSPYDLMDLIYRMEEEYGQLQGKISDAETYQAGTAQNSKIAGWNMKYGGMDYGQLKQAMESATDPEEKAWLQRFADTKMTRADYGEDIATAQTRMEELDSSLEEYRAQYEYWERLVAQYSQSGDPEDWAKLGEAQENMNSYLELITQTEAEKQATGERQWQLEHGQQYDTLAENSDYKASSGYNVAFANDNLYRFINDRNGMTTFLESGEKYNEDATFMNDNPDYVFGWMTDEEVANYNYLYQTQGRDAANGYLEYLRPSMEGRSTDFLVEEISDFTASGLGGAIVANALSIPMNLAGGVGYLDLQAQNFARKVTGSYAPINYNSEAMLGTHLSRAIRGTTAAMITDATGTIQLDEKEHPFLAPILNGRGLADVYSLGMSGLDSKVAGVLTGNPAAAAALLATSASTQGVLNALERGATDEQALTMGFWTGVFEALFEYAEVDNLLKGEPNAVKNVINQMVTEGLGEGFTDVANSITDAFLMADKSAIMTAAQEYLVQNPGMTENEAIWKAVGDAAIDAGWSMVGGAASGGFAAGAQSMVQNYSGNMESGRHVQSNEMGDPLMALARDMAGLGKVDTYAQRAASKPSTLNMGKLYNEVFRVRDRQDIDQLAQALVAQGVDEKDATKLASVLGLKGSDIELTRAQERLLERYESDERVMAAWMDVLGSDAYQKRNAGVMSLYRKGTGKVATTAQEAPGQVKATEAASVPEAKVETTHAVSEDGKTHLVEEPEKTVKIQGIESIKDGKMMLKLDDGSVVDSDSVSYADEGDALIYEVLSDMNASAENANAIYQEFKASNKPAAEFALDLQEAYQYGSFNQTLKEANSSPAAQIAWNEGRMAVISQSNKSQSDVVDTYEMATETLKQSGKERRTDHHAVLEEGITALSLTETQKASYELADRVAQAAKVDIIVYDGEDMAMGYYMGDTVYLNLNASNKNRQSMMAFVLGHELVHRAKKGSPKKYQAFADFLMEQYGKQGSDLDDMIADQIQAAKDNDQELSRDEAFDEVVADACQRMLLDTDAGLKLAQFGSESKQNKGILDDIKRWITEFIEKLRSFFKDLEPDSLSAQEFAKFDDGVKQILADMYVDMTMEAGEHLSAIKEAFGEDATIETNDRGEFTMAQLRKQGAKFKLPKREAVTVTREQRIQNMLDVSRMEAVYLVDSSKLIESDKPIEDQYEEVFEKWGWNIESSAFGDVSVKRSSIKSEQAHGETAQKVASIEAIPSVIEKGKVINVIDKEGDTFRLVIAAPIKIGNDTYYMGVMLQRNSVHQRLYLHDVVIEKEVSSLPQDILITTGSQGKRKNLFVTSILDKVRAVKYKEMINQQYMDAVAVGDISLAQKYVDEAALVSGAMLFPNGKVKHYYHGTTNSFTSFDMRMTKPGNHGYGIYVTMVKSFAAEYGEPVGVYVMTDRIATHDDHDIKADEVAKLVKHYRLDMDSTILKHADSIDEWVNATDDCTILQRLQEFIVGNTKSRPADMLKDLRKRFLYDGLRVNRETIIWDNRLLKSSEPIVRDEAGNIIPLTERFDTDESDIRYKLPVGEDTSPRALLANAFEGVVQNDIDKRNLDRYQSRVAELDAEEAKLKELRAQIRELSFAKGPKDKARLSELRTEANATANRINTLDKMLLRFEASAPLQGIIEREKEAVRKRTQDRVKTAAADQRKKAVESMEKRQARMKLDKLVLDTVSWIRSPKKGVAKCPDILKKPYMDFLNGIDTSSQRLGKGGDPTKMDLRMVNAMSALADTVDKITAGQDPGKDSNDVLDAGYLDLPADFVKKLRDMVGQIREIMENEGDRVINSMTAKEVRELSKLIKTLNHAIREMSTLYANQRFANAKELGVESVRFLDSLGQIKSTSGFTDFVNWQNALPYYAFKRFGAGGESVFEGLMDAQDKLAHLAKQIFDFQEKTWTGEEADAWSKDVHTIELADDMTEDGEVIKRSLTLTTADAMSIYCLYQREQGRKHLLGGGVRVIGIQKGSRKSPDSISRLTVEDIDTIIGSLTDRQVKVAAAMQKFMSTVCAEWGNEISMKRFLTREFTESDYFPIESDDENMTQKDPTAQQTDLFRLLNISATKGIDPNANNRAIVRNIFDVFIGHSTDMARLNAFALPMLDYMKWYNYREKQVTEKGQVINRGVRESMRNAYGDAAKRYVMNLIKDVNGRPSDGGLPSFYSRMLKNAKTAAVGSSLRVATLQITSYPRAALVLSPKSLAVGLTKVPNIKRAKEYCGIALWKSFGFYDTNIGRSIEDQMKGVKDVKQKIIELSLKGAEIGDAVTWGALWNACEYEVASTKKHEPGTNEFYEAVGKKLREVVYATQVVDSTLTRSEAMRSKDSKMKELTSFMSEPTLSANILMDAGLTFEMEKRRTGNAKKAWELTKGYVGRALAVYSIGQIAAALMEAFWDAWRDDEDEEYWRKFVDAFVENLVLDIIPFNKIPIVSDIVEAALSLIGLGYFSTDSLSSSALSQSVSAVKAWADLLNGKSSATVYNALYKSTRAVSSILGVSVSGVMREGVALWNNTAGAYDVTLKLLTYGRSTNDLAGMILDAINDGDYRQADSLMAEFKDEDSYKTAIRKALRENDPRIREAAMAFAGGDVKAYNALLTSNDGGKYFSRDDIAAAIDAEYSEIVKDLRENDPRIRAAAQARMDGDFETYRKLFYEVRDEGVYDFDTVMKAVNAEETALEKLGASTEAEDAVASDDYEAVFKVEHYYTAVLNGDQTAADLIYEELVEEKRSEGYLRSEAESSIASSFTSQVKASYMDGDISRDKAVELLADYTSNDESKVKEWDFELEHDFSWSARARKYRLGEISADELMDAVMDIEGDSEEDAQEYIRFLDLEMEHEDIDITADDASAYFKHAEPSGISVDVWLDYKERTAGIENDVDPVTGKKIKYTAVKKIMKIIDSLPITDEQKTALAKSQGWADSTIRSYKLW